MNAAENVSKDVSSVFPATTAASVSSPLPPFPEFVAAVWAIPEGV